MTDRERIEEYIKDHEFGKLFDRKLVDEMIEYSERMAEKEKIVEFTTQYIEGMSKLQEILVRNAEKFINKKYDTGSN